MTVDRFYLFLTLLVIAISGNPAVDYFNKEAAIILPAFILLSFAIYKRIKFTSRDVYVLTFFIIIYLVHLFEFGEMTLNSSLGMLLRMLTALLAVRVIPDFFEKYTTVMYILAIMSLVFFIPYWLGFDLSSILAPISIPLRPGDIHIGLHNFTHEYNEYSIRNRGFFWEAGAFAGYLIVALLFTLKENTKVSRRFLFILMAALISSQSTTGYLAFSVLAMLLYYIRAEERLGSSARLKSVITIVIIAVLFAIAYFNVPFLHEKISDQFKDAQIGEGEYYFGRFGNFLFDLDYIQDRPFFGWSSVEGTRHLESAVVSGQGNGLSGYAVKYGLVGIIGYLLFSFKALSEFYGNKIIAAVAIIIIMILLNGEQYLNFPIFLSLMFISRVQSKSLQVSPIKHLVIKD